MIQINLLPDVKTKFIDAQRTKHLVLLSSIIVSAVALLVVIILAGVVYGAQNLKLNNLQKDIQTNSTKLQQVSDLDKILTIQNQLNSLPALHNAKPVTSRLFGFLPQITPNDVQIASLNLSFTDSTIKLTGTANSLASVNKFVDTLKFTKYTTDQSQDQKQAFSQVVLASFGTANKGASYSINMNFDTALFSSSSKTVTLVVPKITSTRSETEQPGALFNAQTNTTTQQAR